MHDRAAMPQGTLYMDRNVGLHTAGATHDRGLRGKRLDLRLLALHLILGRENTVLLQYHRIVLELGFTVVYLAPEINVPRIHLFQVFFILFQLTEI